MVSQEHRRPSSTLERRTSGRIVCDAVVNLISPTGTPSNRPPRIATAGIAPINSSRATAPRPSLLAASLGFQTSNDGKGRSSGYSSHSSSGDDLLRGESLEYQPSPTAARLRTLARSVRAVQSLGTLKVKNKYLATSPLAAAGGDGEDGPQTPLKATAANLLTTRVIVLPTNEFSTDEMKYRLDPLDPVPSATAWNVHDALDAISTVTPLGSTSSTAQTVAASTASSFATASARTSSISRGLAEAKPIKQEKKVRWTPTTTKATDNNSSTNNNATTATLSPLLRRNSIKNDRSSRASSSIASDHASLLGLTGGGLDSQFNDASSANGGLHSHQRNLEARLRCSRSLYKLSCQAGSELSIIQGGAIAQIAEFSDVDHIQLHELCAATLANLTAEPSAIDAFAARDGIPALLELSWSPSLSVKLMCITALCRLSCRAAHAAVLAKSTASIEFLSMMSYPSEQLQTLAISCIVNLIYYGHSFPDRIFLGEPHASQNQLGILSISSQLALAPSTMQFVAGVLFNLALYRTSCSGALRGGGAEILHGLTVHVCKSLEDHHPQNGLIHHGAQMQQPTPRMPLDLAMSLLRLLAHTLANFTSHVDLHTMMSGSAMKTLALMLVGGLRDLGSRFYSGLAEERVRVLAVPCSRALANLSSNEELRKGSFTPEIVQLTAKMFLVERAKLFFADLTATRDEQCFELNILRAVVNLTFDEPCTAQLMEFADVMPRLTGIVLLGEYENRSKRTTDNTVADGGDGDGDGEDQYDDDEYNDDDGDESVSVVAEPRDERMKTDSSASASVMAHMRQDALIAILNLAHQGAYSHELLKHLDGKLLARAAEAQAKGSRLKYVYNILLSNILFESRLQQIVYGDLVVHSLVDGFNFFTRSTSTTNLSATDGGGGDDPFSTTGGNADALAFKASNLAFPDDQERFLSAISTIAGELQDPRNIERLVTLALDCIQPIDPTMAPEQRTRHKHITRYSAAILYSLARSSAACGEISNRTYSNETVDALIAVCEHNATATATAVVASKPAAADTTAAQLTFCSVTQAYCAATLYYICATGHSNPRVIQALITTCISNEETLSLLACSAAFAIISFTPEGRQQLVGSTNLAKSLNRLGRTSQVECQQYAAIAACNLSTLQCIWTTEELKDFIVIALLRANSIQAKQIHAKTLANLLSHIKGRAKAVEDGVLYALMKLSHFMPTTTTPSSEDGHGVGSGHHSAEKRKIATSAAVALGPPPLSIQPSKSPDVMGEVFNLGLQVLFNLSCDHQYHKKLMGKGVVSYLAAAIQQQPAEKIETLRAPSSSSSASVDPVSVVASSVPLLAPSVSTESRRFAMGIICNLTSYEVNHKELMHAQVIDVIRSYVDQDIETRASAAMAVRNLSCRQPWVELICERRTLQMLISFTQCDHAVVKHFAIQAVANCSQVVDSLHLFGELRVARAVMMVLETMRPTARSPKEEQERAAVLLRTKSRRESLVPFVSPVQTRETSMSALKCLLNVASDNALAQSLVEDGSVLQLLSIMESSELGSCDEACTLAATMLGVLAGKPHCAEAVLKQRVVGFCGMLHRQHPQHTTIAYECAAVLMKLSTYQPIQAALTETYAIQVLVDICSSPCGCGDFRIRECAAIAIRNLTLCVTEHTAVFYGESEFEDEAIVATKNKSGRQFSQSAGTPGSHTRRGSGDGVTIGRVMERHLLQGVKYFQEELQRFFPDQARGENEDQCASMTRVLVEVCVGIANLSTAKTFRIAMVRNGIVPSLLRVFRIHHDDLSIPPIVRSVCSATLHRLALEEEATVDGNNLLVPSLLEILRLSDDELHQVQYECEKVSMPTRSIVTQRARPSMSPSSPPSSSSASSSSTSSRQILPTWSSSVGDQQASSNRTGSSVAAFTPPPSSAGPSNAAIAERDSSPSSPARPPLLATVTCVTQNYREPKWTAYIIKTMISSAFMVPQLEKKQIRSIGLPKLSFLDMEGTKTVILNPPTPPTSSSDTNNSSPQVEGPPTDDESSAQRKGGYVLPTNMEKFTSYLAACHEIGGGALSMESWSHHFASARAGPSITSSRDGDRESLVHSRKFDRHMRVTRRNHRHTNSNLLPLL